MNGICHLVAFILILAVVLYPRSNSLQAGFSSSSSILFSSEHKELVQDVHLAVQSGKLNSCTLSGYVEKGNFSRCVVCHASQMLRGFPLPR